MRTDELRAMLTNAALDEALSVPAGRAQVERRARRQRGRVVAASAVGALVVVAAAVAAIVALQPEESSEVASVPPLDREDVLERWQGDKLEAFMRLDATDEEIAAVEAALAADPEVVSFEFVSQAEALEELDRIFADDPNLIENVNPEDLPTSFRVETKGDRDALAERLEALPGVDAIVTSTVTPDALSRVAVIAEPGTTDEQRQALAERLRSVPHVEVGDSIAWVTVEGRLGYPGPSPIDEIAYLVRNGAELAPEVTADDLFELVIEVEPGFAADVAATAWNDPDVLAVVPDPSERFFLLDPNL